MLLGAEASELAMAAELAGALFLTALAGEFAHCSMMCSPFVLAQLPVGSDGPSTRLARLSSGALTEGRCRSSKSPRAI